MRDHAAWRQEHRLGASTCIGRAATKAQTCNLISDLEMLLISSHSALCTQIGRKEWTKAITIDGNSEEKLKRYSEDAYVRERGPK